MIPLLLSLKSAAITDVQYHTGFKRIFTLVPSQKVKKPSRELFFGGTGV
jgi:hypothetical protein